MNISNDIVFNAVSAFVDAISDGIAKSVEAKTTERMDRMDKLIENTLNNTPAIIENLNDRIQKLEDKFDNLSITNEDQVRQLVSGIFDEDFEDRVTDIVCDMSFDVSASKY